jgi:hypothetical protein
MTRTQFEAGPVEAAGRGLLQRRVFLQYSAFLGCVPTSLSHEVGAALGAQTGEAKLREVITAGGLRNVRRAAETLFNMILEARP